MRGIVAWFRPPFQGLRCVWCKNLIVYAGLVRRPLAWATLGCPFGALNITDAAIPPWQWHAFVLSFRGVIHHACDDGCRIVHPTEYCVSGNGPEQEQPQRGEIS